MANAILMNGKATEGVEVVNSIIEEYMSQTDIINANNFIDFVNKTTFEPGPAAAVSSTSQSGQMGNFSTAWAQGFEESLAWAPYWYYGWKPFIYKVSDTLLFMVWGFSGATLTNYNAVALIEVKDNAVTKLQQIQLTGRGVGLEVLQLSPTNFVVASGGYYGGTGTGYACYLQGFVINTTAKSWTTTGGTYIGSTSTNYSYYNCQVSKLFKTGENTLVAFYCEGNNGNAYYPNMSTFTFDATTGTVTLNTRYLYSNINSCNHAMHVTEIDPGKKYAITTFNGTPYVNLANVSGVTASWSTHVTLPMNSAQNNYQYIYKQSYKKGNFLYVPYYNGATWILGMVDCSKSVPSLGQTLPFTASGANYPAIYQTKEEDLIVVQMNGNQGYGQYIKINELTGGLSPSTVSLTVSDMVGNLRQFVPVGETCGFALYEQYGTAGMGLLAVPLSWEDGALNSGIPQHWNDIFGWTGAVGTATNSYTIFTRVSDNYAIALFSQKDNSYYASLSCFAIYQNGLELRRSTVREIISKEDSKYTTNNQYPIVGLDIDEDNNRATVLFKYMSDVSNYNLYLTTIEIKEGDCYIAEPELLVDQSEVSQKTFVNGWLVRLADNNFLALYNYAAAQLYGKAIKITPAMRVVPAEKTGRISGVTLTQATPDDPGRIVVLDMIGG